ncbi:MAG: hypothetical protein U5M23_02765 [Marinagarivorans sp.]|nr:hypothetical protein [Marinagarivorans sp.]
MTRLIRNSLLLIAIIAPTSWAETLFKATYKGTYSNINITMVRSLSATNEGYQLSSKATSFMARIHETSDFTQQGITLKPSHYIYERKIFGASKKEALSFDWNKQLAIYSKGKKIEGQQEIYLRMLDPTLYQLQLQLDLARDAKQPFYHYTFIRRGQTKTYQFKQVGTSELILNKTRYPVVIFTRAQEKESETLIWLIPSLDYTIGKIERTEDDGNHYQVELTDYESQPNLKKILHPSTPEKVKSSKPNPLK